MAVCALRIALCLQWRQIFKLLHSGKHLILLSWTTAHVLQVTWKSVTSWCTDTLTTQNLKLTTFNEVTYSGVC